MRECPEKRETEKDKQNKHKDIRTKGRRGRAYREVQRQKQHQGQRQTDKGRNAATGSAAHTHSTGHIIIFYRLTLYVYR